MKKLLPFLKPYTPRFLAALLAMGGVAGTTAILMLLVKDVVDKIFIARDMEMLELVVWVVPCLFMIKTILSYTQNYLMVYIGQRIILDIRNKLFGHIQRLSLDFFHKSSSGHILSRMTNDLTMLQGALSNIPLYVIRDGLTAAGLVGVLFYLHWKFALIATLVFPLASIPIVKFGRKMRRTSKQGQAKMADLYSIIQESLQARPLVKAFCREDYESERFIKENNNFFNVLMRYCRVDSLSSPVMELLGGLAITFIIWYGGREVIHGTWTTGGFFSFLASTLSIYSPLRHFAQVNSQIQSALSASERVFELLEEQPSVQERHQAILLPPFQKEIVFENVSFAYRQGQKVLANINLTITQGQVVALVGPSGSGKTTLAHLLLRFFDPTEGRLLMDGRNVRDASLLSLRSQIGIVTQDIFLFNDSLRQNLLFANAQASEKTLWEALRAAHAEEFVSQWPEGLDTVVGERGVRLSGGQKQRIAIARALLKNPPILILDEATSALDTVSERLVQEALELLMQNRTVLVIAHRLTTIQKADRIIVLEAGKIVESGDHQELMAHEGTYRRLYHL